jgi:hypothetical protein
VTGGPCGAGGLILSLVTVSVVIVVLIRVLAPDVPSLPALDRAAGVQVLSNATGGSRVDTESDKGTYRYVVLGGRSGESSAMLLRCEVAFL